MGIVRIPDAGDMGRVVMSLTAADALLLRNMLRGVATRAAQEAEKASAHTPQHHRARREADLAMRIVTGDRHG